MGQLLLLLFCFLYACERDLASVKVGTVCEMVGM